MSNYVQKTGLVVITSTYLFAAGFAQASAPMCEDIFAKAAPTVQVAERPATIPKSFPRQILSSLYNRYFKPDTRDLTEKPFNYLSDVDYIREKRLNDKLGVVRSIFSKKYDTRIYFTATGTPDAQGNIPVVDPQSKALYIYFHGSGTAKASGVNFSYKMNKMATMGYSVIGMDMPFHADGSRSSKMFKADNFFASLHDMINEYRVKGMPVFMVGHSFGPDIAAEYVQRYPFDIDGVDMISPGGFNEVLEEWYEQKTAKMSAAWGDTVENDDGASWAGIISSQFKWRQPRSASNPDPTVINPNLRIRITSGEWEEYVPGELDERGLPTKTPRDYDVCGYLLTLFANAKCTIEPKVGHYIFEHKDANGHDVILRELLALDNHTPDDEKQLKEDVRARGQSETLDVLMRYSREKFFKAFVDHNAGGADGIRKMFLDNDVKTARKLTVDYNRWVSNQREFAMTENIINTKNWAPAFYRQNQQEIDALDPKKSRAPENLVIKYYDMLEKLSPALRDRMSTATDDVYKVPEKQGPPAHVLDKIKNQKQDAPAPEQKAS